jgi:hypothetical protein
MSKINNNPLLKGASGMLGDVVVYRQVRGGVIMANKPKKTETLTENQKPVRDKFKKAVYYAKRQMLDAVSKAEYATKISDKLNSAYIVAMKDFLNAPTVDQLDLSGYNGQAGDKILIQATDDFRVESVAITILSAADAVIESGAAVENANGEWEYTATVANVNVATSKYQIQAKDKPGNITTALLPV